MEATLTEWLHEVLGVRKHDGGHGHGIELKNLQIFELSGVDSPASGFENWILLKAATETEEDAELAELDARMRGRQTPIVPVDEQAECDGFPGLHEMSDEELLQLRELLDEEPEVVEDYLEKRAPLRSAFQDLVLGETNRLDLR